MMIRYYLFHDSDGKSDILGYDLDSPADVAALIAGRPGYIRIRTIGKETGYQRPLPDIAIFLAEALIDETTRR